MKKLLLLLSLVLPIPALAGDTVVAAFKIDALRVSGTSGMTYVKPNVAVQQVNSSCSKTDFYAIHKDDDSYTEIYSALLTAAASGKAVYLWVSDNTNDCSNERQRISVVEASF